MKQIYLQLRERARAIVAGLPDPAFYTKFSEEIAASENLFASTPVLIKIKKEIIPLLENDFGHGVLHSVLVCRDAGAIVMIEMQNNTNKTKLVESGLAESDYVGSDHVESEDRAESDIKTESDIKKTMTLVQIAGLLHDIKRKHKDHALKGAEFAENFLKKGYALSSKEIDLICSAIREHEAFKQNMDMSNAHVHNENLEFRSDLKSEDTRFNNKLDKTSDARSDEKTGKSDGKTGKNTDVKTESLLSGALYDADKFRWGPDNFTHTVWDMVIFSDTPFEEFKKRYPTGMTKLLEIKNTFRTDTGKKYGPDFIDLGLETGEMLFKFIQKDF